MDVILKHILLVAHCADCLHALNMIGHTNIVQFMVQILTLVLVRNAYSEFTKNSHVDARLRWIETSFTILIDLFLYAWLFVISLVACKLIKNFVFF